ncbi:Pex19 protein [Cladochytrium replicatum]|nr:Pex19 protein [Cladochytrium replicatum]
MASNVPDTVTDDDLDNYLDDILDDFSAKPDPKTTNALAAAAAVTSADPNDLGEDVSGADFAKQLASGMEGLMKDMGDDPEFKQTMEQLMSSVRAMQVQQGEGSGVAAAPESSSSSGGGFQGKITETLNKLRDSSSKVEAEMAQEDAMGDDGAMKEMMQQLEALMQSGDFDAMFGNMMDGLLTKSLLHEPMKDLASKYPEWLEKNRGTVPADKLEGYEKQFEIVKEIVALFDESESEESTPEESKKVADLMTKMQEYGDPPEDMMKELAPGLETGPDGLPKFPGMPGGLPGAGDNCPQM